MKTIVFACIQNAGRPQMAAETVLVPHPDQAAKQEVA